MKTGRIRNATILVCVVLQVVIPVLSHADIVILRSGKQIEGTVANREMVRSQVHLLARISVLTGNDKDVVTAFALQDVLFVILEDGEDRIVIDIWGHGSGGFSGDTDSLQTGTLMADGGSSGPDCEHSQAIGKEDAAQIHSSAGWLISGLVSGVLLGILGAGLVTAIAAGSHPMPKDVPVNLDRACYIGGYTGKAKSKNTWAAVGGSLVGITVLVAVLVSQSD